MTPRLMLLPLALALVATITFASGESDTAAAAEKEMVLDPTTGEMVTAPEYGGTIRAVVNFKNEGIDPYYRYTAGAWIGLVNEKLGVADWAIDRSVVGYTTLFLPDEAITGQLAESWENPDPLTYVFKIRDGVFWHDKAPVNGRQLTAHDVEYSWQRLVWGVDGGEPSPDVGGSEVGTIRPDRHHLTDALRTGGLHRVRAQLPSDQCRLGGQSAEDQSRPGAAPVCLPFGNGDRFQRPEGALERHPRAPSLDPGHRPRGHRRELPAGLGRCKPGRPCWQSGPRVYGSVRSRNGPTRSSSTIGTTPRRRRGCSTRPVIRAATTAFASESPFETTVVSYLAARSSRDLVIAAYQEITREWWRDAPSP